MSSKNKKHTLLDFSDLERNLENVEIQPEDEKLLSDIMNQNNDISDTVLTNEESPNVNLERSNSNELPQVINEEKTIKQNVNQDFEAKLTNILKPKESFLDTHTRLTLFVRNDIMEQLDELSKQAGRGFKTKFVNLALELTLKIMKDKGLIS